MATNRFQRFATALAAIVAVLVGVTIKCGETNFSHLPEQLRPHRPLLVRAIIGAGRLLESLGIDTDTLVGLDKAEIMQSACALANVSECDYDVNPIFDQGLSLLIKSQKEDSRLTLLGKIIASEGNAVMLATRLRLIQARKDDPDLFDDVIDRPIFIIGLPRSGTTFLHNLLGTDNETFRVPLYWEYAEPIPASGSAGDATHLDAITRRLELYKSLLPAGFTNAHPVDVDMSQECIASMGPEFDSGIFGAVMNVSQYTRWLVDLPNHTTTMNWHAQHLSYLQNLPHHQMMKKRWLLKSPHYLLLLRDVLHQYPDARFIHTHRRPDECISSMSSVIAQLHGATTDQIDLAFGGPQILNSLEIYLSRSLAVRDEWSHDSDMTDRIVDIHLTDLKADPLGVVEKIYRELGLGDSERAREGAAAWLQTQKHFVPGLHKPDLRDFGLSSEAVFARETFSRYCSTFGLDCSVRDS